MISWVNRYKVDRIRRLIDQQIVLRTNQLVTFVLLQRAIDQREVRGELRVEDIEYIKTELQKLGLERRA
jgi:hypothetical protein